MDTSTKVPPRITILSQMYNSGIATVILQVGDSSYTYELERGLWESIKKRNSYPKGNSTIIKLTILQELKYYIL